MLRDPEPSEMRRANSALPFSFSYEYLFQHKASFPKRFLEETGNPKVCLCPVGTATHVTLVSVSGSVLGSYIRSHAWRKELEALPLTQPKPPWGPMPAGQWAPALRQPAPLLGHASCPPPPRRRTRRTTHPSCTGNLEGDKGTYEFRGQAKSREPPAERSFTKVFSSFNLQSHSNPSLTSNSVKQTG